MGRKQFFAFGIPLAFFAANIFVQNYNLGKFLDVISDEGVYLYAAKLIGDGFVPYTDFFLAHPPFLMVVNAGLLKLTLQDMNVFHSVYTMIIFSTLFPLYSLVQKITKNTVAATLSLLLFSTYQGLVVMHAREFSLRAVSLPFLAFALYFFYCKQKPKVSALFLSYFAMTIIPNLLLSLVLLAAMVFESYLISPNLKRTVKKFLPMLIVFNISVLAYYGLTFLIPSAFDNIVNFQLARKLLPFANRKEILDTQMLLDWPMYYFGIFGGLLLLKRYTSLGIFSLAIIPVTVFTGVSFYDHYLIISAVTLAIGAGVFIHHFAKSQFLALGMVALVLFTIYKTAYDNLRFALLERKVPEFFTVVNLVKNEKKPLFSIEPIHALYAKKDLTFSYYVADMRAFGTLKEQLDSSKHVNILERSNTIIIGPFENRVITGSVLDYISRNYRLIYEDPWYKVYAKSS